MIDGMSCLFLQACRNSAGIRRFYNRTTYDMQMYSLCHLFARPLKYYNFMSIGHQCLIYNVHKIIYFIAHDVVKHPVPSATTNIESLQIDFKLIN